MGTTSKGRMLVAALALSAAGILSIQQYEGTRNTAYLDSVGIPTICTGSTKDVFIGQKATPQECDRRLQEDTSYAGQAIRTHVTVRLTQAQYDALVSFVFNVGGGAFSKSTLLKRLNNAECEAAADEFLRWDKAGGKRVRGLTARRQAESKQFREGCIEW